MYTAFADGDLPTLSKMCGEGLLANFRARIISRPNGERWQWELVKYNKRPRVMSHRGASLGMEGFGIRQAVVRISSRQKLTRYRRDGTVVPTSGKEKDVTEYLVVQRNMKDAKEQDWVVWGTTEETILEKFQEEQAAQLLGER
jgi:mitochondrial protein MBA1